MSLFKNIRKLLNVAYDRLHEDNRSGSLMAALNAILKAKSALIPDEEFLFDKWITAPIVDRVPMISQIGKWILHASWLEIHMAFDTIPNERRNQVSLGLKTALLLISNLVTKQETYDTLVAL